MGTSSFLTVRAKVDLSLIIVNFFNSGILKECLESIYKTVDVSQFEIIIVNNSCGDRGLEPIKKKFPAVNFIENKKNIGFASANNQASKIARGDILIFLNPDVVLSQGAVQSMLSYYKSKADIGILGPKVLNSDGSLQYSCRGFPTLYTGLFNRYSLLTRFFPNNRFSTSYLMSDFDHNSIKTVDWISGCCMMISREVFRKIGMFDEKYFLFNEDIDICRSAKNFGYKVVYFPDVHVLHRITSSNAKAKTATIIKRHLGMSYYYRKHHFDSVIARGVVNLMIILRCLSQVMLNLLKQERNERL